jgi:hypothetical protein
VVSKWKKNKRFKTITFCEQHSKEVLMQINAIVSDKELKRETNIAMYSCQNAAVLQQNFF